MSSDSDSGVTFAFCPLAGGVMGLPVGRHGLVTEPQTVA